MAIDPFNILGFAAWLAFAFVMVARLSVKPSRLTFALALISAAITAGFGVAIVSGIVG